MKDRFKRVRKELGLTQAELAEQIGVQQVTVTAYETGNRSIPDRTVKAICEKFNVDESWLRTGTGEMFVPVAREVEVSNFLGQVMQGTEPNFKRRFISAIARLDESEWEMIEKIMDEIVNGKKKDAP